MGVPDPAPARPGEGCSDAEAVAAAFLMTHRVSTRAAYAADLRQWFEWCARFGLDPLSAHRTHVDGWVARLSTVARPSTMARKVSSVRSFYAYAASEGYIAASPVPASDTALGLPAVPRAATTPNLDREQIAALLAAAVAHGPRDAAVVALLLFQGLPVSQLCALEIDDLAEQDTGWVLWRGPAGPGRRQALAPAAAQAVAACLRAQGRQPGFSRDGGPPSAALIVDANGRRLTRYQVEWIVERCGRAAGIEHRVTPHWLRQACTTILLDAGVPLRDIQVFLGHANAFTTQRYGLDPQRADVSPAHTVHATIAASGPPAL